jgi:thiol-disulfide isomerase/thioredoxin
VRNEPFSFAVFAKLGDNIFVTWIWRSITLRKSSLVIIAVVAVIVATYLADRATRQPRNSVAKITLSNAAAKPAPDVTLRDLDGKDLSLAQYKGKVVLVNFWATWCEPCQVEIPWLIEMQQKYAARGFTVLGIAMDEEGASVVTPWVQKERFDVNGSKSQMNYPIVIGDDAAADKFGGLLGYPTSVLISRDGKVVKRITGIISYDEISRSIESQL